MDYIKIDLKGM